MKTQGSPPYGHLQKLPRIAGEGVLILQLSWPDRPTTNSTFSLEEVDHHRGGVRVDIWHGLWLGSKSMRVT